MVHSQPRMVYLTAGAANMYCGSCLHDNTLAGALTALGIDVQLLPTYTPIRTDEENFTVDEVFFGGINVFLEQKLPMYRFLPAFARSWLDRPGLIRWATSRFTSTRAESLGPLTVSMLRGEAGYQAAEIDKLCGWLRQHAVPDLLVFSNVLIAGCAPRLKHELGVPITVTLQGDDIFLEYLPKDYQSQAFAEIRRLVDHIDAFLVHSRYYAEFMSEYLGIPTSKFRLVPLGIDTRGYPKPGEVPWRQTGTPTIGYLARLAPEKGLHLLVDAFLELRRREATRDVRLAIAGWLGENNRAYAEGEFRKLRAAGLADAFAYSGSIDRTTKIEFLKSLDVLSVPTTYREPKGLFVLEACAAGVPVVQPAHGAFPELLGQLGCGRLVKPHDAFALADELEKLLCDEPTRRQLGTHGSEVVHRDFHAAAMARRTLDVLGEFLPQRGDAE